MEARSIPVPTPAKTVICQQLVIPISPGVHAMVTVPRFMTEADWEQFMAVLQAMKPALVPEPPAPTLDDLE